MGVTYSVYEAKARFSEVIRQVRAGRTITVTFRGEPVAEIRAIEHRSEPGLDERLRELERSGSLLRPMMPKETLRPAGNRPGALARFLAERDE